MVRLEISLNAPLSYIWHTPLGRVQQCVETKEITRRLLL